LVEARAEVMAAYWRHQDALSLLKEVRVSRMPWFTYLQGSYAKSESRDQIDTAGRMALNEDVTTFDSIVTADDNQDEAWSIEAGIEIPLFSFHGGATRVQRANVKRFALALRESLRQSQAQFDMAYRGWRTAVTRVDAVCGVIAARQAKATELIRKLDEAGGMGPEARLKVDEMILQLRRVEIQAIRARDTAWWRFQGSAGVRLNDRVAE
jgi:outer membrane protein TolC